jgi:hypothetical protein
MLKDIDLERLQLIVAALSVPRTKVAPLYVH